VCQLSFTTSVHQYPKALAPYTVTQTSATLASITGFTPLTSLAMCVKRLCDIYDAETMAFLTYRPGILINFIRLLITIHGYLNGLGLRRFEDYLVKFSIWVDTEIENWRKPQIVIKLLENGLSKISEKGLDELRLLENIIRIASELASRETLAEILILVE